MVIANFFNIKYTNGLFYYGAEYVRSFAIPPERILVRAALAPALRKLCPEIPVVACTSATFAWEVLKAAYAGNMIYTPTSHPIPLLSRQVVVLHDTYPFLEGAKSWLKRWLFVLAAHSSTCRLGYVNHADGLAFYRHHRFPENRLLFAPNRFPGSGESYRARRDSDPRLVIGMVGSDSSKKNYGELFTAVRATARAHEIRFFIYGHETPYLNGLVERFPDLAIQLVPSDQSSIAEFLAGVDAVVSVAKNEGFGRPIASALRLGIPCFLIDCPVFREFFHGAARFAPDVPNLVANLFDCWDCSELRQVKFEPPRGVVEAFDRALQVINEA